MKNHTENLAKAQSYYSLSIQGKLGASIRE